MKIRYKQRQYSQSLSINLSVYVLYSCYKQYNYHGQCHVCCYYTTKIIKHNTDLFLTFNAKASFCNNPRLSCLAYSISGTLCIHGRIRLPTTNTIMKIPILPGISFVGTRFLFVYPGMRSNFFSLVQIHCMFM